MCRGLAVLMDRKGRIICKGLDSHSETMGYAMKEDECLKYEVIVTDRNRQGYRVEVDEQIEKNTRRYEETVACLPEVEKWIKKNELKVLRWLLFNISYKEAKGDICNSRQKSEGDIYNSRQKAKGDINNFGQEAERYISNQKQKSEGYIYNSRQKSEGDIYNDGQKSGRNIDNSTQECNREYYIGLVKLKKYPNATKIIKKARNGWNLTLPKLMKYCAENSREVLKMLSRDGV